MSNQRAVRFWLQAGMAGLTGLLAVVTGIWPDWIEIVFGIDPDKGSGSLEWVIVLALFAIAVTLGARARLTWQRAAQQACTRRCSHTVNPIHYQREGLRDGKASARARARAGPDGQRPRLLADLALGGPRGWAVRPSTASPGTRRAVPLGSVDGLPLLPEYLGGSAAGGMDDTEIGLGSVMMTTTARGYHKHKRALFSEPVRSGPWEDGHSVDTVRALCHDLRQPLAAIILLATPIGPRQQELEHICAQARWLADIVDAVLVDAAADHLGPVDVNAVVRACVERALPTSRAQCRFSGAEGAVSVTRRVALGRAVSSLIDNAVRAAGEGGHVDVSVVLVAEEIAVTVVDDGPGFGYVEPCHSLGLSIARALSCSCGGRLALAAGAEHGVEARLTVPLVRPARMPLPPALWSRPAVAS